MRTHATGRLALLMAKRHRRARSYGWRAVVYRSPDRYGLIDLSGSVVAPRPNRPWREKRMPAANDVGEPGAGEPQARLLETLGLEAPPPDSGFERFNIAHSQKVLGVVDDRGGRRVEELRWGLVPHWAKELNARFSMINARAETLAQRPAYRRLVARAGNRCLILADGWYELQRPEDPRQPRRPLYFSLTGGRLFCFAGLWTCWSSPDGQVVPSCAIITCEANELVRPVHDRMPVVFADPELWQS